MAKNRCQCFVLKLLSADRSPKGRCGGEVSRMQVCAANLANQQVIFCRGHKTDVNVLFWNLHQQMTLKERCRRSLKNASLRSKPNKSKVIFCRGQERMLMLCAETCISRYFAWWAQLVVGSPTRRRDDVLCGLKEKVQISLLAVDLTCNMASSKFFQFEARHQAV